MRSECDGLWTGLLGHTCSGVSTTHVATFAPEEAAALMEAAADGSNGPEAGAGTRAPVARHAMDKWSVCTGRKSVTHKHVGGGWTMSTACKGSAVTLVHDSTAVVAAAAAAGAGGEQ
jgi:hypothetical protein